MHSWNDKKLRQKTAGGGRVLESGLRLYTELKFARKPPFSPYAATDDNRLEVKYPCLDANEPEDEQPEDDDIEQRSGGLADLANTAKKPLEGCKLRTYTSPWVNSLARNVLRLISCVRVRGRRDETQSTTSVCGAM